MKNIIIITMFATGVVVLGGVLFMVYEQISTQGVTTEEVEVQQPEELKEPAFTIVRTNLGYEPNEITVKKGDVVLWTNESNEFHWPASDLHPTHSIYSAFDPLKPIAPGDEWKFKFDEVGVWKFHDHLRANKVGTVTVVE